MLNEEKVMANLLANGEEQVETNMWYPDNEMSNNMAKDQAKFKNLMRSSSKN